jgi:hypothetical protein
VLINKFVEEEIYCNFYECECGCEDIRKDFKFCPECGIPITNMEEAEKMEEILKPSAGW